MRGQRALYLLGEGDAALSEEANGNFMRAYYRTVCDYMLRVVPQLKPRIESFERTEIRRVAKTKGETPTDLSLTHSIANGIRARAVLDPHRGSRF